MSVARALAANTAVQAAGKAVSTLLGVIVVGIMTRLLGVAGFGKYATANAFLQVFAIVLDLGLNVLLVQMLGEHAGDEKYERRAVSALFTLRTLMALVILSAAPIIGLFMPYDADLKIALFAIWGSFFFTALNQVVIGVQQRHLKMHVVAIGEVAGRAILLAGVLIATVYGWGLVAVVSIVSVGSFVNFLINILIARRYASFKWNIDPEFWKLSIKRAWPIGVSILFSLIYFKADTLILSFVRPVDEVGIYGAAYRVLEIMTTLPFMYAGVLLPIIARAWSAGQRERFINLIKRSFEGFSLIVFPIVFGVQAVATQAMVLVAGPEFRQSGDILRILIIAMGLIYVATIFSHAIVALDKQRAMIPVYIGTAIITLVGYAVLIPAYGIWAAAWLTVLSEACVMTGNIVITMRTTGMSLPWKTPLKALGSSIVMLLVTWPIAAHSLLLGIAVGIGVYVALTFATGALSKDMLMELLATRQGAESGEGSL